jgi:RNA polymerase sigma-70 factor (ECF subfamily)
MTEFAHDMTLIEGLRSGDEEALQQIYTLHYRALCYFAEKLVHNREEAEDIAVDSFLKLLNKKEDFDTVRQVKSFLFTATRNACFDYLRKIKRHQASHQELRYLNPENEIEVVNHQVTAKVLQSIYAEMEHLPAQCKLVFKSIFVEGKTTSQIADELGISPQTVLNQKSKAVQLLRSSLLKQGLLSAAVFIDLLIHLHNKG